MKKRTDIWIIAGEASGDLYGARLAKALRAAAPADMDLHISGMGGVQMSAAGVECRVDSTELGVMGVFEVFRLIGTFIRIFCNFVKWAEKERPDAVILIDYPGFNIRFAKKLRRMKIPVIWYISPHVWVWGKKRIPKLVEYCRKMLLIFPFETEVYAGTGLETEFVGHPLLNIVDERHDPAIVRDDNTLVLLPGSRKMEIDRLWPTFLMTAKSYAANHPGCRVVAAVPREKVAKQCREIMAAMAEKTELPVVDIEIGRTGYWQQKGTLALAASGTVTVESALAGLPLVVAYRMNWFTIILAKFLVKLYRGFFTMANIVADKMVYEEFLQHHVCVKELLPALERIAPGGERRNDVIAGMDLVRQLLSPAAGEGNEVPVTADTRAASAVLEVIQKGRIEK